MKAITGNRTPPIAEPSIGRDGEQSRARYPDIEGFVERDGMQLFYEVYGEGEETIFLLPTWSLVHSRIWKMQIAYFARHFRVLTMDGLGNGRSDRCRDPRALRADGVRARLPGRDGRDRHRAGGDGAPRRVAPSTCWSWRGWRPSASPAPPSSARCSPTPPSHWSVLLSRSPCALPQRRRRSYPLVGAHERGPLARRTTRQFAEWFFSRCLPEPHSTKGIEDGVGWALDTDPETLIATAHGEVHRDRRTLREPGARTSTARCW